MESSTGKKFTKLAIFIILAVALFLRLFRTGDLLGFHYDQGRDAKVIWDLWKNKKFFLIGPVTGLEGIFLGPLYYFLIAPFYLLSAGSPILPAVFVSSLSWLAVVALYFVAKQMFDKKAAIIAVIISSFSSYLILSGRWFSNPTPILLPSVLLVYSLWKIMKTKGSKWWIVALLLVGISLHFEAASAFFYLPVVMAFYFWQRKNVVADKNLVIAVGVFFLTLVPQLLFNFRHDGILFNNFKKTFIDTPSFGFSGEFFIQRLKTIWAIFYSKILPEEGAMVATITSLSIFGMFIGGKKYLKEIKLLLIFLGVPFVGYLFYKGNNGVLYDYYLTGYYLPMIMLFSAGLSGLWKENLGKVAVVLFFITFSHQNFGLMGQFLSLDVNSPRNISLGNQLESVDWIINNSKENFNVDIYVPPVITHSYDYLFLWRTEMECGEERCGLKDGGDEKVLYTLYEEDFPHPERLEAWLARQKGIGEIQEEAKFGGITVQRRNRF